MATKDKKLILGRRQQTGSPSPRDSPSTGERNAKNDTISDGQRILSSRAKTAAAAKTPLVRKLARGQNKKNQKKITLKLNPRAKRKAAQKITKALMNTARVLDAKKLLKNGKLRQKKVKEEEDDGPPVLEPIFPIEDNLEKKPQKRRVVRNPAAGKVKIEPEDAEVNSDSSVSSFRNSKRTRLTVKTESVDTVTETIEGVISGTAIPIDQIKVEPDSMSESSRSDIIKPKKLTKKQKLSLLKKEIKKENIENALTDIGPNDQKLIDMLDLNVLKVKKTYPAQKRRHTIEKYPMDSDISNSDDFSQFSLFSGLPRSNSPRAKRKVRASMEGKVINPYTIRSTARLLRNGKQRKLKQHLFDGLDSTKKKKRLCSDFASGEMSKLSGYDSDSSFSDMASVHGAETSDSKEIVVKKEFLDPHSGASSTTDCEIQRRLSLDNAYCTDTNSNVCDDLKVIENQKTIRDNLKEDAVLVDEDVYPSPSIKVPEKLLILDIMKQTFNETIADTESKSATTQESVRDSSEEDLLPVEPEEKESEEKKMSDIISKIVETMGNEEFTATINTTDKGTALVMQNGDIRENSPWEDSLKMLETSGESTLLIPAEDSNENHIAEEQPPMLNETNEKEGIALSINGTVLNEEDEIPVDDQKVPEYHLSEEQSESVEQAEESNIDDTTKRSVTPSEKEEVGVDYAEELQKPDNEELPATIIALVVAPTEPEEDKQMEALPITEPSVVPMDMEEPQPSTSKGVEHDLLPTVETEEEVAIKESILKALGLQSLKAAEEAKLKDKDKVPAKVETYTGTLKTVIKLNRDSGKKKGKNHPLKMTLQKNKSKNGDGSSGSQDDYKIMKEGSSSWKNSGQSSDTAGAQRKSHYSNRSNPDGSSEHTSDGEVPNPEVPAKALVIPEKASSFAFHPYRLCKDECSYCFGKFGLFDTPCHIAQIKSAERQDKILSIEKHLTRDSCLCDACYRHIDRKANTPSYVSKSFKRGPLIAPGPKENHCHVLACNNVSTNVLRRKWIIKMKKQICQVINIDLDNPGLHSIPICDEHYVALEHLMVCAMCKRRLARNHIHYIGPEVDELNAALLAEDIPMNLSDKPVVCKLCKCFATIILRNSEDKPDNFEDFFVEYKKRLLHFNNIVPMDEASAEEPIVAPMKERTDKEQTKKKRKLSKHQTIESSQPSSPSSEDKTTQSSGNEQAISNSRPDSPSDYLVDYNSLIPSIAMDCEDNDPPKEMSKVDVGTLKRLPKLESLNKSVDITTVRDPTGDLAMQRLGSNPSLSVRQLFPGEEDLGFQGDIDFGNVKEKTQEGWEKCNLLLQYDKESKQLWQELQKPYGNHSSFFRHLIMLEKYFRKGQLELVPEASPQAVKYTMAVQNRLRAYDNIPSGAPRPFNIFGLNTSKSVNSISHKDVPITVTQTSVPGIPVLTSSNVSVTAVRPTSVSITQLSNNAPIRPLMPVAISKAKPAYPPGLISLHPGTNRPIAPLMKQSTKIKFPITKNWRPTLIPIDPTTEKKMGLVQVISGGKPFHITLEDYKKMCAIKRSFENKQKKQQDAQKRATKLIAPGGSIFMSNKSLTISKTSIMPKQELEPKPDIGETILDKLDQQVENLETKFNESMVGMPKIPKSLTVIPQTVARKTSRPASPVLLITQKPGGSKS